MEIKKRILVLCTGNSCRSQMAEGYLRELSKGGLLVFSAGIAPEKLNDFAVKVMREDGVDISSQKSQGVDEYEKQSFDYVLTVCGNARDNCPVFQGDAIKIHWPIDDPAIFKGPDEERIKVYSKARDEIKVRVLKLLGDNGKGILDCNH